MCLCGVNVFVLESSRVSEGMMFYFKYVFQLAIFLYVRQCIWMFENTGGHEAVQKRPKVSVSRRRYLFAQLGQTY